MAKNNWNDYSATAASNTDIGGIDIDENCVPSNINDALRTVLAHTADVVSGTVALSSVNIDGGSITGITDLAVADGGTGAGTFTANGVLVGNGTSAVTATAVGTSGHVLTSNGSGNAPTFQAAAGGGASDIDGLSDGKTFNSGATIGLGTGAAAAVSGSATLTAVGYNAGNDSTSAILSTYLGYTVGQMATGSRNCFLGATIADQSGLGTCTGTNNTIVGTDTARNLTTGSYNAFLGMAIAEGITTGGTNTAVGAVAGNALTTGIENTILGYNAASALTTGGNNTIIGNDAAPSSNTVSNEITLGDTNVDKFRIPGLNFVIKDSTATDNYVLTVDANGEAGWEAAAAGGATDINGLSDGVTNSSGFTVGLGLEALSNDDGGSNKNTALGYQALKATNSNFQNTAVGYRAGTALIGTGDTNYGRDSSLFGFQAGAALTTGRNNTAVGAGTLDAATTPDSNTAIGKEAGGAVTTGANNVLVGSDAGYTTTTGSNNIILGSSSEASSATVSNEITLGDTNITKFRVPGLNFIIKDSTATDNYVLTVDSNGEAGWEAAGGGGASDINGLSDGFTTNSGQTVGLGSGALINDDGGAYNNNTAVGFDAGNDVTSAYGTVAIGYQAGHKITTGGSNHPIGYQALGTCTTGSENIAVGFQTGEKLTTGVKNILLGGDTGKCITTGGGNIFIGHKVASESSPPAGSLTGSNNVVLGFEAAKYIGGSVTSTVALGNGTLSNSSFNGNGNTAIGNSAGLQITTGTNNTMIGNGTYGPTTGSNNTLIGYNAAESSNTVSNEFTLGNSSISSLRCQVQTISSLSDRRDKKDIEELPLGIDFINTLKPVKFTWNMRDGAKIGQQEAGFIAQDLDEAQIDADAEDYLSLVLKNNPEKLEASYGKLVPVLVKAVQELSAEISNLKKEIANG